VAFFDVSDALFDYTARTGSAGIGSLTYSSPSSSETPGSVPETFRNCWFITFGTFWFSFLSQKRPLNSFR
jgi:hypothetical protein